MQVHEKFRIVNKQTKFKLKLKYNNKRKEEEEGSYLQIYILRQK